MRIKKAVSPIISTVLLIMIVIILAVIILLWTRGFIKETALKEIGGKEKTVDKYCSEVKLDTNVENDGSIVFTNVGNVPLYSFKVKSVKSDGTSDVQDASLLVDGNTYVNPGGSKIIDKDDLDYYANEEVTIFPIILGEVKSGGTSEFECPEFNGIKV